MQKECDALRARILTLSVQVCEEEIRGVSSNVEARLRDLKDALCAKQRELLSLHMRVVYA